MSQTVEWNLEVSAGLDCAEILMGEECIVLVVILLQRESRMFKQYKMIVQKHVSAMKWIEMDKVKCRSDFSVLLGVMHNTTPMFWSLFRASSCAATMFPIVRK